MWICRSLYTRIRCSKEKKYLKFSVSWEGYVEWHSSPFAAPSELAAV
jgi:hypothetical protein